MAATDNYASSTANTTQPIVRTEAVTPHDANFLARASRMLYVGGAGDLTVHVLGDAAGDFRTLKSVPAGTQLAIRVDRVLSTGTTATYVVAGD